MWKGEWLFLNRVFTVRDPPPERLVQRKFYPRVLRPRIATLRELSRSSLVVGFETHAKSVVVANALVLIRYRRKTSTNVTLVAKVGCNRPNRRNKSIGREKVALRNISE